MEEIWKDVVGYEGYYQVSSLGRIRSVDREIIDKNGVKKSIHGKMPCFYGRFRRKLTILKGKMAILRGQDNHF